MENDTLSDLPSQAAGDNLATREIRKQGIYPFIANPEAFRYVRTCQTAYTYLGVDPVTEHWLAIGITCKRWSCEACAARKIKRLAFLTHNAKPNRLLTLTTNPEQWESPRHAFDGTAKQVPELIRHLRKDHGEVDYFRVTECTAKGWPHYHLMMRSGFLPHPKIKAKWCDLTAASIVDVRKVSDDFRCYSYLTKYLTKLHRIEWTERHVSYSRNFFRAEDMEKYAFPKLEQGRRIEEHPHQFLAGAYWDEQVTLLPGDRYRLPGPPPSCYSRVDREVVGLHVNEVTHRRYDKEQTSLAGMELAGSPEYS